ncbi:hypothetical protein [Clostridium botulinum]|uniref:hypothetical protein n=1 Tax=Clostridium botulinum TaxID=1491 RepID=UPI0012AD1C8F|nr:hypothetical protein [Clostridium botulinum]
MKYGGENEWKMIFVNPESVNEVIRMSEWNYNCNLFIVIDYVISYVDIIGKWIERLTQVNLIHKIRIVLIEREGMQDNNNYANKKTLWLTKMHEGVTGSHSLLNSLYRGELLPILHLDKKQLKKIVKSYSERQNKTITDSSIDYLINQLANIDGKYLRPIYLLFVTDAYLKGQKVEWDKNQLENWLYNDELKKTEKYFCLSDNNDVFNAYKVLLCIATMCGGLEWKEEYVNRTYKRYIDKIDEYAIYNGKRISDILNITEYYIDDKISAMEPDLIGEYFCISYLENEVNNRRNNEIEEIHEWIQFAWEFRGIEYSSFLIRVINDYPQSKVCTIDYLFQPPKKGIMLNLSLFYVSILEKLVNKQQIDQQRSTINIIKKCVEDNADNEIIIIYAEVLANFANEVRGKEEEKIVNELNEMIQLNPSIEELKMIYAYALSNYTSEQSIDEVSRIIAILKEMYESSDKGKEYSRPYARALSNMLGLLKGKGQYQSSLTELQGVYNAHWKDEVVVELYCQGLWNISISQSLEEQKHIMNTIEKIYNDNNQNNII